MLDGDAIPDKAGHRVKAMGLVNQAIAEVQAGIATGRERRSVRGAASLP